MSAAETGTRPTVATERSAATVDWAQIRNDFPYLERRIDGAPIIYLDAANTSQKPRQVIDAMAEFAAHHYAPINRGAYRLAAEATDAYEGARHKVARFINAPGAALVTLTKPDDLLLSLPERSKGGRPCVVLDPFGLVSG